MKDAMDEEPVERPAAASTPAVAAGPAVERAGDTIDRYRLLEPIGEGGMGTVWLAEQREPVVREVALKVIKLGMDTREVVVRFEAERQALALMDHPNIAQVFDGGSTRTGRPYFVMELVRGVPVTEYCDAAGLGVRERLELFTKVCHGVQHAHSKGVIHRDLKPSNVLVSLHDGVAVPKIIDFGIAKATDAELTQKTMFTQHAQVLGTPEYMAPEQAEMGGIDVDTRADVYSLGVLLYEVLTGTKPFDLAEALSSGFDELLRRIREVDPPKPSTRVSTLGETASTIAAARHASVEGLGRRLRGDLDWVVMRAMEKDRARRYATVAAFADDLQAFLDDRPVSASPPSARYVLSKFVRRNRAMVVGGVLVALSLVGGTIGTGWGLVWALDERERAADAADAALEAEASATRERDEALRQLSRAEEYKAVVNDMLAGISMDVAGEMDTQLLERILALTSDKVLGGEVEDELVAAELNEVLGSAYFGLQVLDRSERHAQLALEVWQRGGEAREHERLAVERLIALIEMGQGSVDAAVARFEALRPRFEAVEGPAALGTLQLLGDLAHGLVLVDRLQDSVRVSEELLARIDATDGLDPRLRLIAIDTLAGALRGLGREEDAIERLEPALRDADRELGRLSPTTVMLAGRLGGALLATGRTERGIELLQRHHDDALRIMDADHPLAIEARTRLGMGLGKVGRMDEALVLLEEAVRLGEERLGPLHPDHLSNVMHLALYLGAAKELERASALGARAVAGFREVFGPWHPETDHARTVLLLIASDAQDTAAALAVSDEILASLEHGIVRDPRALHGLHTDRTRWLFAEGRVDEGLESYRIARGLGDELGLAPTTSTFSVLASAGSDCMADDRFDDAIAIYEEGIALAEELFGANHRNALGLRTNLGICLRDSGRTEETVEHMWPVYQAKLEHLGALDPWTGNAYEVLVSSLGALDDHDGVVEAVLTWNEATARALIDDGRPWEELVDLVAFLVEPPFPELLDLDLAREVADAAVERGTGVHQPLAARATVRFAGGDVRGAIADLEAALEASGEASGEDGSRAHARRYRERLEAYRDALDD